MPLPSGRYLPGAAFVLSVVVVATLAAATSPTLALLLGGTYRIGSDSV